MNAASPVTSGGLSQGSASRYVALLVVAVAGATGLASILTLDVRYSADRWPENRPFPTAFFSANDRSRWCTVWSLVERGTYQIDEIIARPGWDTIDKVRLEGHFYSSKPPFLATLAAGCYWVLKHMAGFDLAERPHQAARAVLILFNLVPWVAALWLLSGMLERYARLELARVVVMMAAGFCTLLTPFLVTFNNHTVAAASLVFALAAFLRIRQDNQGTWWWYALAGFWGAFTACCELPAALWGAWLFLVLAWKSPRQALLVFLPAALLPLAFFLVTNWLATGGLVPVYASFSAADSPYKYIVDGIPSYWMEPSPIDQSEPSALVYLFHCVLGHHGIFSLSPIFLLTAAAWLTIRRHKPHPLYLACQVSMALTIWVLAFYVARSDSRNYGGMTSGLRWAYWLVPLWLLGMVPVLDAGLPRRGLRGAVVVLAAISAFSAGFPRFNPWQQPWLAQLWERFDPVAADSGVETADTWLGAVPDPGPVNGGAWLELTGWTSHGQPASLRLDLLPARGANGPQVVARWGAQPPGASQAITFDVQELPGAATQGRPERRLVPAAGQPEADRELAAQFLRGLPGRAAYRVGAARYVKCGLRREAFRCRVVAATVERAPAEGVPRLRFRRVAWLSDEVPFGVVQVEEAVLDPRDNAVVFKQRLVARAASGFDVAKGNSIDQ